MKRLIFTILLIFAVPVILLADDYHYNNTLIGDRAAGMGGAYIAVSDDPSGMYYNPAGLAYSTGRNLSASVNAFYNLKKTYKGVIGGNGWTRTSSSLLPNFFGISQPLGGVKLGFSYAVPDSALEDQDQTFYNLPSSKPGYTVSQYVINFNNEDNTYNIGPTIAVDLGKKAAIGLTLYGHFRKNQWILNQVVDLRDINTSTISNEWTNQYYESSEEGIKPVLGLMFAPTDKLSVGLSASKIFVLSEKTTFQETKKDYAKNEVKRKVVTSDNKKKYPYQLGFGIAYFPTKAFLVSADVNYYNAVKYDDAILGKQDRRYVVNGAVGMEYYFSPKYAVRAGAFTNIANTKKMGSAINENEQIDLYGGSLSLSHFTRNTSVTIGGTYSQGDGKARILRDSYAIQDATIKAWTLFISSSYTY